MSALPDAATADAPDRRTLAHAGVADAGRVQTLLTSPEFEGVDVRPLVELLGHAADPDRALLLWVRLAEREPRVHHALRDPGTTARLLRLLGASEALGEFLIRRPEQLDLVLDPDAAAATAPAVWVWPVPSCWLICCRAGPESWEKMSSVKLLIGIPSKWKRHGKVTIVTFASRPFDVDRQLPAYAVPHPTGVISCPSNR